jgi:hypothetical protein
MVLYWLCLAHPADSIMAIARIGRLGAVLLLVPCHVTDAFHGVGKQRPAQLLGIGRDGPGPSSTTSLNIFFGGSTGGGGGSKIPKSPADR